MCVRLNHHLPTADERERLVRELLRVARKFVVMTFFDYHSLKNLGRRLRRPLDKKPPKMTMTVARVHELAREGGFELVEWPALARLGSGHRYALMVETDLIMELPLVIQPIGVNGPRPESWILNPASGGLIKEERKTVVWRQIPPDGTPSRLLKLYRHRHPSWLQRRGWERGRAQREFDALRLVESHGIACSPPPVLGHWANRNHGQYELLASREVPGACDLAAWLEEHPGGTCPNLTPLFALIAKLHHAGLQHGALLDRNILVAGANFHLIDMPRSRYFVRSIAGRSPGWFDLRLLVQSLSTHCSDEVLVAGLAGYPLPPMDAWALVRAMRPRPLTNRRLNRLIAVYTLLSCWSRLFYRQA